MKTEKIRVIKDFEKLSADIQEQIKLTYPNGFGPNLIRFTDKDGRLVSALPFETDEKYYLVRMNLIEANSIIEEDEDYDDDGILTEEAKKEYEDKYADKDYLFEEEEKEDDDDY
jgi:hypothetical protein